MTTTIPTYDIQTNNDYLLGTAFCGCGRWGTIRFSDNSVIIHEVYQNGYHVESSSKMMVYGINY